MQPLFTADTFKVAIGDRHAKAHLGTCLQLSHHTPNIQLCWQNMRIGQLPKMPAQLNASDALCSRHCLLLTKMATEGTLNRTDSKWIDKKPEWQGQCTFPTPIWQSATQGQVQGLRGPLSLLGPWRIQAFEWPRWWQPHSLLRVSQRLHISTNPFACVIQSAANLHLADMADTTAVPQIVLCAKSGCLITVSSKNIWNAATSRLKGAHAVWQTPQTTSSRHDLPTKEIVRAPNLVASVSILYLRSPSTSGKSFVIAMTVANTVTKDVTNLWRQQKAAQQLFEYNIK